MSKLITTSLFGSVKWFNTCPPSWKEKAFKDLTNMLSRIWIEPEKENIAAKRGIEFEKQIQSICEAGTVETVECSKEFRAVLRECDGGQFQKKVKRYISIDGVEYCLYGKVDVWFPDILKDLKTTGRFKGRESFLGSMQHILYCYVERKTKFRYVVSEFDEDDGPISRNHMVDYEAPSLEDLERIIIEEIQKIMQFLKGDEELWKMYSTIYSKY